MKLARLIIALAVLGLALGSCSLFEQKARVDFTITDAPVNGTDIDEVNVAFDSVEVNADGEWSTIDLAGTASYDLLSLTNGLDAALGTVELPAASTISQIRFGIASVSVLETGSTTPIDITVPSGELKIVGGFDVPKSGGVTITVDFDVRKSLVKRGNGSYNLKPTLRAIVEGEAGKITGTGTVGDIVYAYANGTYSVTEPTANAEGLSYAGAYTSAVVGDHGTFTLAYMDAGTYDLYLVDAAATAATLTRADVVVTAGETTADISFQ